MPSRSPISSHGLDLKVAPGRFFIAIIVLLLLFDMRAIVLVVVKDILASRSLSAIELTDFELSVGIVEDLGLALGVHLGGPTGLGHAAGEDLLVLDGRLAIRRSRVGAFVVESGGVGSEENDRVSRGLRRKIK